jgi:sRNA-binding carbon storage regulator CsrA
MERFLAKQKVFWTLVFSVLILPFNGCVYLAVGSVGALGGYVASPDTVEGTIVDRDYDDVWTAVTDVLSQTGILEQQNQTGGIVEARVQGANVKVSVFHVGSNSVKLIVKARRSIFPKIKIAQEVYVKIVSSLDVGQ